jgi:hypothetical protein
MSISTENWDETARSIRQLLSPLRNRNLKKDAVDPPPPFLPVRRRPLTPTSPRDSFITRVTKHVPSKDITTSTNLFFNRLPAELRRYILIFAFRERTLHTDLRFARPLLFTSPDSARSCDERGEAHSRATAPLAQQGCKHLGQIRLGFIIPPYNPRFCCIMRPFPKIIRESCISAKSPMI